MENKNIYIVHGTTLSKRQVANWAAEMNLPCLNVLRTYVNEVYTDVDLLYHFLNSEWVDIILLDMGKIFENLSLNVDILPRARFGENAFQEFVIGYIQKFNLPQIKQGKVRTVDYYPLEPRLKDIFESLTLPETNMRNNVRIFIVTN